MQSGVEGVFNGSHYRTDVGPDPRKLQGELAGGMVSAEAE
jgi:hypothetical protein